jgi:trimethylamine-N-oxide reductase (cytochrome c)
MDGKIIRIRPLHYDSKYALEQFNPWEIRKNGKTLKPMMKALPFPFSLAYKKRAYSPNRLRYPMKRVQFLQ